MLLAQSLESTINYDITEIRHPKYQTNIRIKILLGNSLSRKQILSNSPCFNRVLLFEYIYVCWFTMGQIVNCLTTWETVNIEQQFHASYNNINSNEIMQSNRFSSKRAIKIHGNNDNGKNSNQKTSQK